MFIAGAVLLCSMECVHGLTYYGSKGNAKFSDHIRGTISYVDRNKRFFRIHWSGVNKNPGGRWGSSGWSNDAMRSSPYRNLRPERARDPYTFDLVVATFDLAPFRARRRGTVFLFALRGLAPENDCFLLKVYAISLARLDCVMVYVQHVESTAGRIG